jgi:hypothetical protein
MKKLLAAASVIALSMIPTTAIAHPKNNFLNMVDYHLHRANNPLVQMDDDTKFADGSDYCNALNSGTSFRELREQSTQMALRVRYRFDSQELAKAFVEYSSAIQISAIYELCPTHLNAFREDLKASEGEN